MTVEELSGCKEAAAQTNSATTAMPTIDNHSKVNPLSSLDRSDIDHDVRPSSSSDAGA
jgi:hypothetical protein